MLFGVIPGPNIKSAAHLCEQGKPFIDGVELRLDFFEKIDIAEIKTFIEECGVPVILTVRRKDQGGAFARGETTRLELIECLCGLQPAYIDLEYDVPNDFRKRLFDAYPRISFISSYHDFTKTPDDLDAVYEKIKKPFAHIHKLAVTAQSSLDTLRMLEFVQSHSDEKIIGLSMGEEGKATRILAPVIGSFLSYAYMDLATAPGQMNVREMQEIYRFSKLNRRTAIYALIGDPVDKSLGALIHNAVFDEQNINAVYLKIGVKKEDLAAFVDLARKLPFKGFSVTMPHKEAVLPFLDQVSIPAQAHGACNTIEIAQGQWIGHNTDSIGALNAIEKRQSVNGKHIVFIGAGGAAKAVIVEAARRGAFVTVINRTPDKAIEIVKGLKGRGGGWELLSQVCREGYDIIINCIPDSQVIEDEWILPKKIAMDIVYVPKNTPFLLKATQKKCRIIFGYEMFVGQAVEQQRIWFPQTIDCDKALALIEEKVVSALA